MTAMSVSLPTDLAHTPSILLDADHNRAHEASPARTIRVDRTEPRWSVRVVLEGVATITGDATDSISVIIHDRDADIFPVFRIWFDWQDVAALAKHIEAKPLTDALRQAEAEGLAGALIGWLGADAAACIAALTPQDAAPPRVHTMTRREREQQQLIHDIAWYER